MQTLYLVHPWLDTLLEREDRRNATAEGASMSLPSPSVDNEEISDNEVTDDDEIIDEDEELDDATPLPQPQLSSQTAHPLDREMRARRLVAHIRQPFGAILLTLDSTSVRTVDYKRVVAESLIRVQFQEHVSLDEIHDNVRTLDVL